MSVAQLYLPFAPYLVVRDGDPLAGAIANRHYSRLERGNTDQLRFCRPGKRLILLQPEGSWLFVWVLQKFRRDGQVGAECVLFRNEAPNKFLSSEIVLLAEKVWNDLHGFCRKFTYVNPRLVRSKNPGCCFQKAGWTKSDRRSSRGLILLSKEVVANV